jgi:hypothetical protein
MSKTALIILSNLHSDVDYSYLKKIIIYFKRNNPSL